jgi:hypothetical protein
MKNQHAYKMLGRDCSAVLFAGTWYLLHPPCTPHDVLGAGFLEKKGRYLGTPTGTSPFPKECLPSRMIINSLPLIFYLKF